MEVDLEIAENLSHALELLAGADPGVRPVAGATDVLLRLESGKWKAHQLVSIAGLPEIAQLRAEGTDRVLGAGTLVADLLSNAQLARECPCLVDAARTFASPQIRNRATVGGNLGNASPAADLAPPLIALGAEVTLVSQKRGKRSMPVEELFLGFGKTRVEPDELILEIRLSPRGEAFQAYAKFGSRGANVIATVNMALCLELSGETVVSARVAFGSVAPKPLRATRVEMYLTHEKLCPELVEHVREAVLSDIAPIDDVRGSKAYKERLAVHAIQDALTQALLEVQS